MVFFQHYNALPWGWTGVDLFFVLSGFLITGILFDTRNDPHRVMKFYVRRTLRIFPLYYGVMLAIFLVQPATHWQWTWRWLVWPAYLGNYIRFIHESGPGSALQILGDFQISGGFHSLHTTLYLGHFWSLCVEEQFYLVWPWLVFWIRDRRKLVWVCAATLPLCLGMRVFGQHLLPEWMLAEEVLYRATPFRLDALLIGGLAALMLRGSGSALLLKASRIAFPVGAALLLVWAMLTPAHHLLTRPYPYPADKFTWGLSVIDVVSVMFLLVALQPHSLVYRVLTLRPLREVGRLSYGAYVLHDIPHLFYGRVARTITAKHTATMESLIALASTLLLAKASFVFFESRFLNLKERWTAGRLEAPPSSGLRPQGGESCDVR